MSLEIWKDIEGYEGKYQVSSLGRIKSADYLWGKRKMKGRVFALKNKTRYVNAALYKNNVRKDCNVHRLVSLAFVPNPLGLKYVNHKNGIKTDNKAENLEWVTHQENIDHAYANGLVTKIGNRHYAAKLTIEDVANIRNSKETAWMLSKRYKVGATTIKKVIARQTWKSVV